MLRTDYLRGIPQISDFPHIAHSRTRSAIAAASMRSTASRARSIAAR